MFDAFQNYHGWATGFIGELKRSAIGSIIDSVDSPIEDIVANAIHNQLDDSAWMILWDSEIYASQIEQSE